MTMGAFLPTFKAVALGTIADFFYTPVWWYTRGLWRQLRGVAGSLGARQEALAVEVWLKNILVPMYGQYDFTGRLISFFMRLAQIGGRAVVLVVWAALLLVWLLVWLLIPVGVVYFIWIQL